VAHFTLSIGSTGPILNAFVGRDILQGCVLVYNGTMGFFTLAF